MSGDHMQDGRRLADLVAAECWPSEVRMVEKEFALLPEWSPSPWIGRHTLRGVHVPYRGQENTGAPGSLRTASVDVRGADGRVLRVGVEVDLDETYGSLCMAPGKLSERVTIDYVFSLRRIDSIAEVAGEVIYTRGVSALCTPVPPSLPPNHATIANVLVDYFGDATTATLWPISSRPDVHQDPHPLGFLPKSRERRRAGRLRVVFLGDSVTVGAEASAEALTFRKLAEGRLRDRFPETDFEFEWIAVGGSRLRQWLQSEGGGCDWERVARADADLVVLEFVNDAEEPPEGLRGLYSELSRRLDRAGTELLLTTPHFTMKSRMASEDPRVDARPYVAFLRDFAREHRIALADVSAAWARLADDGLPYWTLLANGINHPDDRGHQLTADVVASRLIEWLE